LKKFVKFFVINTYVDIPNNKIKIRTSGCDIL